MMSEEKDKYIEKSADLKKSSTYGKCVLPFHRIAMQFVFGLLFGFTVTHVGFFICGMCSVGPAIIAIIAIIFSPLGVIIGVIFGSFCYDFFSKRKHKLKLSAIICSLLSGYVVSILEVLLLILFFLRKINPREDLLIAYFLLIWSLSTTLAAAISYNYVQQRTKSQR